ncbi:ATP synthase F1 subunit delta [Bythopirellula polymerisocia]|uniref:ATP synthase subunit delta n=1 Tax=Bythopirellula polymerisocia TaxID=2528003 RepID=A0A5C6CR02_9BACT|nr:ATP synthase F1 subunit delta [Bythopirellula polymerisocia]TWU27353.1 ATP synthase subunit delta [Bythopirellula polymerisocia]
MAESFFSPESTNETVLDVGAEMLSRVYAKAALNAAGDHDAQQGLMDELQAVVSEVLVKHSDLEKVFDSALVSQEHKQGILERVFGKSLSQSALSFLYVLTKHNRLGMLRQVVRSAGELWKERCNQVTVHLELAQEVDQTLEQEIIATLAQVFDTHPIVQVKINADLIAGFVARVGDRVFDASTRTSLERTRQLMIASAVESIQRHQRI